MTTLQRFIIVIIHVCVCIASKSSLMYNKLLNNDIFVLMEKNKNLLDCSISLSAYLTATSSGDYTDIYAIDDLPRCPYVFVNNGRTNKDTLHSVTIGIKQINIETIERMMQDIIDPTCENYGNHLSRDDVASITSNKILSDFIIKMMNELNDYNVTITYISHGKEYIDVKAPIHFYESLFNTQFHDYSIYEGSSNKLKKSFISLAEEYSLPILLSDYIDFVLNTVQMTPDIFIKETNYRAISAEERNAFYSHQKNESMFPGYIYPAKLKSYYSILNKSASNKNHIQVVFATNEQSYSVADMNLFNSVFRNKDNSGKVYGKEKDNVNRFNHIIKESCPSIDQCAEANLDMQYITSISPYALTMYYYMDMGTHFSSFLREINDMLSPPTVISISYAMPELFLSFSEMRAFDMEARKLALRGVTIVVASGDEGVSGGATTVGRCGYMPYFPASSIYTLTVGATSGAENEDDEEIACSGADRCGITSGGGFSTMYRTPSWQSKYVEDYFLSLNQSQIPYEDSTYNRIFPVQYYSRFGYGYPDVSIAGSNYLMIVNGTLVACSGTSASAPVFAAIISLINGIRMSEGGSSLGWITKTLYTMNATRLMHDITKDPVTGFGSVNYPLFFDYFYRLGDKLGTKDGSSVPSSSSDKSSILLTVNFFIYTLFVLMLVSFTAVCAYFRKRYTHTSNSSDSSSHYTQYGAISLSDSV